MPRRRSSTRAHASARYRSRRTSAATRGVDFFETLARDVRFALRTFRRTPLVALTVVSTIALGLGVVTVAFTFFNMFFFRVDAVRNPDELFAVERPTRPGFRGHVPFTWTEYEAIRQGTNVFTDVAAARPSMPTRINGRAARGMFVSGNFFDMLGVTATRGRTLTQADNEDGGRAVVVLTQLGWEKFKKEIGVRMALGATPRDIVRLVVSQSMRPIAIGVFVVGGLAAVTAIVLLSMPAAGMIGTAIHAFDPLAYAVGLGIVVAPRVWSPRSCRRGEPRTSIRSRRSEPTDVLLSLSDHLHDNLAAPGAGVELDEHDLLPRAEGQRGADERDRQRRAEQRRPHVTRAVVVAPAQVMPVVAASGSQLFEQAIEIRHRAGLELDRRDRRGGPGHEHRHHA